MEICLRQEDQHRRSRKCLSRKINNKLIISKKHSIPLKCKNKLFRIERSLEVSFKKFIYKSCNYSKFGDISYFLSMKGK